MLDVQILLHAELRGLLRANFMQSQAFQSFCSSKQQVLDLDSNLLGHPFGLIRHSVVNAVGKTLRVRSIGALDLFKLSRVSNLSHVGGILKYVIYDLLQRLKQILGFRLVKK